ncbi:hypothetical protein ACFX1Q_038774 [Malus domestica]
MSIRIRMKKERTVSKACLKVVPLEVWEVAIDGQIKLRAFGRAMEEIENPRALRKAQDEVREVLKGKRKVEESDMSELVYLKLVLNESFRLHLPMPLLVPRETLDEYMPKIIPPLHRVPPT